MEFVSASTPVVIMGETEALTVNSLSASDTHTVTNDTNMSGGKGDLFNGNATNDFIEYKVNVEQAGTYNVKIKVKNYNNRGKYQLVIDGTNQGPVFDNYTSTAYYTEIDLGNITFSTDGDKLFRFTCTGKNT